MKRKKLNNLILEALKLKGMNLEKLSQLTGVSEHSLALLLEEQFDKLPPRALCPRLFAQDRRGSEPGRPGTLAGIS